MQKFPPNKGAVLEARRASGEYGRPTEMGVELSYEALRQCVGNSQPVGTRCRASTTGNPDMGHRVPTESSSRGKENSF
jgi:hypothetical protein